jgi:hypothetical protein
MLRKTMIIFATAAALTGGLTADAFARGGGGHGGGFGGGHGGGFGGGHIGGFGGGHIGGLAGGAGGAFARGVVGQHFAPARGHFGHERRFAHRRFVPGGFGFYDYDYACSYGYPYYTSHSCYGYPPGYF